MPEATPNGRLMKVRFLRKTMKAGLESTAFREVPQ